MDNQNRDHGANTFTSEPKDELVEKYIPENEISLGNTVEKGKSKKLKKQAIIIFILIVIAFFALLAFRIFTDKEVPKEEEKLPVNIKIATAEVSSLYATSPISGRVQPVEEVSIIPLANGQVKNVYIKLGDKVSAGTILFEIDNGALGTSINQAADALSSAQLNYDRMSLLYEEGAVSLQQYEQAQSQVITAQSSVNSLNENLSNYIVKSPIDGYVTSVNVAKGSMTSGAGGAAASIADTSELVIKTNVSEYLIGKINIGNPVDIFVKTLSKESYKGTIKEISPAPATGALTYPIVISVSGDAKGVKAGMFTEIKIISDKRDNVLCVPSDSVIIKQGISQLAVLENDLPVFKEVETGLDNGESVEIVSGINPGDTIIVEGQHFVVEGEPIKVVE